jgi:hypothetical protein
MPVHVTIDTGSRGEAELIAAELPGQPQAASRRGYGVIRLRLTREDEARDLLAILESCVRRHKLSWARLRRGDDEWTFKGGRNGAAR